MSYKSRMNLKGSVSLRSLYAKQMRRILWHVSHICKFNSFLKTRVKTAFESHFKCRYLQHCWQLTAPQGCSVSPVSPALRYPKENIKQQPPRLIQILYATWSNSMSLCLVIPMRVANITFSATKHNPHKIQGYQNRYECVKLSIFYHYAEPEWSCLKNTWGNPNPFPAVQCAAACHSGSCIPSQGQLNYSRVNWNNGGKWQPSLSPTYQCQVPCHKAESDQGQLCDYSKCYFCLFCHRVAIIAVHKCLNLSGWYPCEGPLKQTDLNVVKDFLQQTDLNVVNELLPQTDLNVLKDLLTSVKDPLTVVKDLLTANWPQCSPGPLAANWPECGEGPLAANQPECAEGPLNSSEGPLNSKLTPIQSRTSFSNLAGLQWRISHSKLTSMQLRTSYSKLIWIQWKTSCSKLTWMWWRNDYNKLPECGKGMITTY